MVPMDFRVELMGVEMEILTFGRKLTFGEYFDIYDRVLPGNTEERLLQIQEQLRLYEDDNGEVLLAQLLDILEKEEERK